MAKDEGLDSGATVQMSAEELKRLHAELEGKRAEAARGLAAEALLAEEEGGEPDEVAEAPVAQPQLATPKRPAAVAAPAERPAVAAREPVKSAKPEKPGKVEKAAGKKADPSRYAAPGDGAASGGGLLVVGGIGALVAGLAPVLGVIPQFQGMGDLMDLILVASGLAFVGHLLLGLGMYGAVSRTGGVAALVGTLHMVASLGQLFFLLSATGAIPIEGDAIKLVLLAPTALPGTAWLLSGIWAFSAGRALRVMAPLHGIFAVLGGGALIAQVVGLLSGAFGPQDDLLIALLLGGIGSVFLAGLFLGIGMLGPLRRAPVG